MGISDLDRDRIRRRFATGAFKNDYSSFINLCKEGLTAGIDKAEYGTFVSMTLKKDVDTLIGGYMNGVFNFGEFWDIMQQLVGFDLVIQTTIIQAINVKSNGHEEKE